MLRKKQIFSPTRAPVHQFTRTLHVGCNVDYQPFSQKQISKMIAWEPADREPQ